jgi:hypothetical protein
VHSFAVKIASGARILRNGAIFKMLQRCCRYFNTDLHATTRLRQSFVRRDEQSLNHVIASSTRSHTREGEAAAPERPAAPAPTFASMIFNYEKTANAAETRGPPRKVRRAAAAAYEAALAVIKSPSASAAKNQETIIRGIREAITVEVLLCVFASAR